MPLGPRRLVEPFGFELFDMNSLTRHGTSNRGSFKHTLGVIKDVRIAAAVVSGHADPPPHPKQIAVHDGPGIAVPPWAV